MVLPIENPQWRGIDVVSRAIMDTLADPVNGVLDATEAQQYFTFLTNPNSIGEVITSEVHQIKKHYFRESTKTTSHAVGIGIPLVKDLIADNEQFDKQDAVVIAEGDLAFYRPEHTFAHIKPSLDVVVLTFQYSNEIEETVNSLTEVLEWVVGGKEMQGQMTYLALEEIEMFAKRLRAGDTQFAQENAELIESGCYVLSSLLIGIPLSGQSETIQKMQKKAHDLIASHSFIGAAVAVALGHEIEHVNGQIGPIETSRKN